MMICICVALRFILDIIWIFGYDIETLNILAFYRNV